MKVMVVGHCSFLRFNQVMSKFEKRVGKIDVAVRNGRFDRQINVNQRADSWFREYADHKCIRQDVRYQDYEEHILIETGMTTGDCLIVFPGYHNEAFEALNCASYQDRLVEGFAEPCGVKVYVIPEEII